jgi:hypothetical protein
MTSQLGVVVDGPWAALECVRIPPAFNEVILDTRNYPLITSSDAHHPEYVGRRPFKLDIVEEQLQPHGKGTEADMEVFKKALANRSIMYH